MNRDSIGNTFFIAVALCLVCSGIVALSAVGLKPFQEKNKALDKKKNILAVSGLLDSTNQGKAEELFTTMIDDHVIDLESGKDVTSEYPGGPGDFDPEASLEVEGQFVKLDPKADVAVLKKRENRAHVYVVKTSPSDPTPQMYIFPIRGKGLWSTLKGFIALDVDLKTVRGLTYYEHAETPGLGGEVDNPDWKNKWPKKTALTDDGKVAIRVVKNASGDSAVDALSGATITSNGVSNMLQYWLGPDGFGPFIENVKRQSAQSSIPAAPTGDSHG